MKIIRALIFLFILINPSYSKAGIKIEDATQCYAISVTYAYILDSTFNIIFEVTDKMSIQEKENFMKLYNKKSYFKDHAVRVAEEFKNLGVSKLIMNGKSVNDANLIVEDKANLFKNKQLIYDPNKISAETYMNTLESLFNNCTHRYHNEFIKK